MTFGVLAYGAYIPRLRLSRRSVAEANAWLNPALKAQGKGERAICNWDEDAVTMAVEAARDALIGRDRASIASLRFAPRLFRFSTGSTQASSSKRCASPTRSRRSMSPPRSAPAPPR
jgi:hydroxymethylglutaryl-CoA synthase